MKTFLIILLLTLFVESLADTISIHPAQASNSGPQSNQFGGFQGGPGGFPWGNPPGNLGQMFGRHGRKHHGSRGNESSSGSSSSEEGPGPSGPPNGTVVNPACASCATSFNVTSDSLIIIQTSSFDPTGCSTINLTCTSPSGGNVLLQWFYQGTDLGTSMDSGTVSRTVFCNTVQQFWFTENNAIKTVDAVTCASAPPTKK